MHKKLNQIGLAIAALAASAAPAFADGTAYFEMPAGFSDNVVATVIGVFGVILVVLGVMMAVRKTTKTANRT